jgi:hypothetical protein
MQQIVPGVYAMAGLRRAHVYLLASEGGLTMVDSGMAGDADEIVAQLEGGGHRLVDLRAIVLTEAGDYLIEATRTGDAADYAEATLILAAVTPEAIPIGECIPSPTEERSVWSVDGQAGQFVSIAMDTTDPSAYLALFDANGKELAIPTADGLSLRLDRYFLPDTGPFLISLGGARGSAVYGLSVAEVKPRPITAGTSQEADIWTQTLWSFDGRPGQIVSISMDTIDERLDPHITLHGPRGRELASDEDSWDDRSARIERFVLSEEGSGLRKPCKANWAVRTETFGRSPER